MKFVVLIPDGSSDWRRADLDGLTPLEAASTPNMDRVAAEGTMGQVRNIPEGFPPGSDVANLCVMGYDPHSYYTGRAPLEAASLGINMDEDDVAFRCNLVWVEEGLMRDFSAGHIDTEQAAVLISFLDENMGSDEVSFYKGLSYRHIMMSRSKGAEARCTPPHDISGQPIDEHLPQGEGSGWLIGLMDVSVKLLADHPLNQERISAGEAPANMIWLWGQGTRPLMPTLSERFGLEGSVISAVDLVKGLGRYAGLRIVDVPGATGFLDTDFGAKAKYAINELKTQDFVYVHVEAPDEASHMGDTGAKIKAIEQIDSELLGPLLKGLERAGDFRLLVLPDHSTPLEIKTHTDEAVPFALFGPDIPRGPGDAFDEKNAAGSGLLIDRGWTLMERLTKKTAGT